LKDLQPAYTSGVARRLSAPELFASLFASLFAETTRARAGAGLARSTPAATAALPGEPLARSPSPDEQARARVSSSQGGAKREEESRQAKRRRLAREQDVFDELIVE
jgi:hypothetical protein